MARTTKRGTCELCGANSNVGTNHGSKVCTNCTHIQSALSKRPQSVANAIRAMGKTEEMLSALIPAGGLAVHVTAELLREISGIVEYKGEDPAELVEAVRRRVLTCVSCDSEDVLHEIREIVGYVPEQGDKGLADAVRAFEDRRPAGVPDCAACDAAEALLEIADLVGKRGASSGLVVEAVRESVNGQTHSESEQVTALRDDLSRSSGVIEQLRAEITLLKQAHDEWEQLAVEAKDNVEKLEAELRNREDAPAAPCASTTYLLDIALRALRGEGPDADQLATLLDAARREA